MEVVDSENIQEDVNILESKSIEENIMESKDAEERVTCDKTGIFFTINGENYSIHPEYEDFDPETHLVDFIRDEAQLKGTKTMCREGGCGACVVQAKVKDPSTKKLITKAVNACLTPVLSCHGWEITTVEKLGNKKTGYHKIQQTLTKFNGTQCGFCTPGMVMNMYSLINSRKEVKVQDVHDNFDGNLCRCTGYRPILDAFKSLASDAPKRSLEESQAGDIEDCAGAGEAEDTNIGCGGCDSAGCATSGAENFCKAQIERADPMGCNTTLTFKLPSGQEWVTAVNLQSAYANMNRFEKAGKKYRIVAGNTGIGVFKYDGPYKAFLDINNIPALKMSKIDGAGVIIGGGVTLTSAIQLLLDASKMAGYKYAGGMSHHLERVANTPVRNNATLAGNLMMKHNHHDFPSDIFLLLDTVGAKINVGSAVNSPTKPFTPAEFIITDMSKKLIISISLPKREGDFRFRSFKITKRYQNAHAYVNAGFLFKVDAAKNFMVLVKPRIVFGGITPEFIHASKTEMYLMGKELGDEKVLKRALEILDGELKPEDKPPEASPEYRKTLSKSLLYKTILGIIGDKAKSNIKSGGLDVQRNIGKSKQTYDKVGKDSVLYKDLNKIEGAVQASGEAKYLNDIPYRPDELHGAFVISTVGKAELKSMDASEALNQPGVVKFLTAKDVPGRNDALSYAIYTGGPKVEPIFVKDKISHAGQPLGMILAHTRAQALTAAKKVKVTYGNVSQQLILTPKEAFKKAEADGKIENFPTLESSTPALEEKPKHTVKGEFVTGGQYHFHMELQSCVCIPTEDGMDVFSATQWLDQTQIVVARALGVPTHKINVEVRRLGGGFGGKVTRATHVSAACAVAANAVNKPVRVVLDMETNMRMIGKRPPYAIRYEVGFDDEGKIGSLKVIALCETGWTPNEQDSILFLTFVQNVYKVVGWAITPGYLLTDTPSNTWARGPASVQAIACIEYIMEHIAHELKRDPLEIRMANFFKKGDEIYPRDDTLEEENLCVRIIDEIKVSGDYEGRKAKVDKFNKENRWKKRGISLMPARFWIEYLVAKFSATVVVYHYDASVAVSHAGVEMGQGINTKVAQTVAHTLQIPLDKIQVKPTNNFVGANGFITGNSVTSELCCDAAKKACEILLARMKPIKDELDDKSWESVVNSANIADLDLTASYMHGPNDATKDYFIWMATIAEVEVDILTGEFKVVRVDLTEDAGKSLNPAIDIGQIEGAYLMGQGLWTSEKLVYDKKTGELLTPNTWEYKPPETKDVPEDFRVTLLSKAPNPKGILRSKAVGEPPLVSAFSVFLALRHAIDSARKDAGNTDWYEMDGPVSPEDIVRLSLTSSSQFSF